MGEEKSITPFENKLVHIGVVVKDMNKAIQRLESLGIGPVTPYDFESLPPLKGELLLKGEPYEGETKVFVAKMGNVQLELFELVSGDSPYKDFYEEKGEGIHHICFAMDDYDTEVARFTDKGAEVLHSARTVTGGGSAYLDIGVGGIIVELEKLT